MNFKSVRFIIWGSIILVLITGLLILLTQVQMLKPARLSIILIFVDCLRPDHLGCYGYPKKTSPNIDRFAKEGLLFENCFSHAPDTRLSYASILTGFLPHETRLMENIVLSAEVETLPEILQQLGYKTVGVASNYLLRRNRGWEQGFLIYDDTMNQCELVRQWPERTAEHTTDRAIELIRQFHKDPLFMWIHYQDPHGPYTPPGPFTHMFRNQNQGSQTLKINRSLSGRGGIPSYQNLGTNPDFYYYLSQYDGEIAFQDNHFGRLIDALKEFHLYEDALIIFSSDHGEGMGEHNYYFAHGENLYSSLIHVPLIIKFGKQLKGRRTDFVQHLDIVPTIFNIIGFRMNPYYRGCDLREKHTEVKEIFSEMDSFIVEDSIKFSLILDSLKLIYTPLYGKYQLFNLKTDPYEKNDLVDRPKYQRKVEDLKLRLHSIYKQDFLGISLMPTLPHITDEEKRKLESLGYVQY